MLKPMRESSDVPDLRLIAGLAPADARETPAPVRNRKILTLEQLAEKVREAREQGLKVVHCHGVFDLLHIGHIRYFDKASTMGDLLVVTVTPDRFVDKGANRPAFTEALRVEAVASLDSVDLVAVNAWPTAEETLRLLRPDCYVKGAEYKDLASDMTGKIAREAAVVEEVGAELRFVEDIVFSSTNLINRYLSHLPQEIQAYLQILRKRYSLQRILSLIDSMKSMRVMVVGDTIIDEYQYCEPIGKSSKDPILAVRFQSRDLFAGGALAVANHVASFADNVTLVSVLGEQDSHEEFIRASLKPNVTPFFVTRKNAPTLVKRRVLDGYSLAKLLEVYIMDDSGLPEPLDRELCQWVQERLPQHDMVLSADFGHGAISPSLVKTLTKRSPFLAAMAQANAGNRGYHTITRYPLLDYGCIAEHELRLLTRNHRGDIRPAVPVLAQKLQADRFVITQGRRGCLVWDRKEGVVEVPAFATNVVDRVGAGDAFLSVSAMAAKLEAPSDLLGFIGNVVGGLAVEMIGNQKAVDADAVRKQIVALYK